MWCGVSQKEQMAENQNTGEVGGGVATWINNNKTTWSGVSIGSDTVNGGKRMGGLWVGFLHEGGGIYSCLNSNELSCFYRLVLFYFGPRI